MRADISRYRRLLHDRLGRQMRGTLVGMVVVALLGTVTAVWENPFFTRMVPVGPWEFAATVLTALLAGVTAAYWTPYCRLRSSGSGGIAAFLGIACPTCNKILMLVFGGPALLAWFDPIRPWLAAAGLISMSVAALFTWQAHREFQRNLQDQIVSREVGSGSFS